VPEKIVRKSDYWVFVIVIVCLLVITGLLYVSGPGPEPMPRFPVSGSLFYNQNSTPKAGMVTFGLTINVPSNPSLGDIIVRILNGTSLVSDFMANWTHFTSDSLHLRSGDKLTIEMPNTNMRGYEIFISVKGYLGTISGKVPESRLRGV
jgi:hypothetical protein